MITVCWEVFEKFVNGIRIHHDLLIDLHKGNKRQGPGGDEQTMQAMQLAGLINNSQALQIADIGCGTGASTLVLANNLNATITAVIFMINGCKINFILKLFLMLH